MPYLSKRKVCPKESAHEAHEANVRHNNKWGKYYHNKQWKLLREWQITNYPLCHCCALEGISRAAEHIHHRIPFAWFDNEEDRIKALTDETNLISVCRSCHEKIHKDLHKPDNFEQTDYYKKIHNMI